jgi:hypothetical protein
MQTVATSTQTGEVWRDIAIVAAYVVAGLALGALTLRRQPTESTPGASQGHLRRLGGFWRDICDVSMFRGGFARR